VFKHRPQQESGGGGRGRRSKGNNGGQQAASQKSTSNGTHAITDDARHALAKIAASTVSHAAEESVQAAVATDAENPAPAVSIDARPKADAATESGKADAKPARARRGRAGAPQGATAGQG